MNKKYEILTFDKTAETINLCAECNANFETSHNWGFCEHTGTLVIFSHVEDDISIYYKCGPYTNEQAKNVLEQGLLIAASLQNHERATKH